MTDLTQEEEAILRQEYKKYCERYLNHPVVSMSVVMSFDDWWRAAADNANED